MKKLIISLLFFLVLNACQPIEKINPIVFDNSQFARFNILSTSVEIKEIFEKKISDPYIGHTLKVIPSDRIINWINDNFKPIGNENIFNVTILDSSITQTQFENNDAKNFDEKNNYIYELFYLLEFSLFDDSGNIVASTLVETSRSTTSGIYISIQEKENIIDDLIYNSLVDISNETNKLLNIYMANYIL
ncbi:hypothetical protein OAP76_02260 [Alphaproteobacteria bacterium]|nr:hypothetical protein [Alphaproteobacteria bacterium]